MHIIIKIAKPTLTQFIYIPMHNSRLEEMAKIQADYAALQSDFKKRCDEVSTNSWYFGVQSTYMCVFLQTFFQLPVLTPHLFLYLYYVCNIKADARLEYRKHSLPVHSQILLKERKMLQLDTELASVTQSLAQKTKDVS